MNDQLIQKFWRDELLRNRQVLCIRGPLDGQTVKYHGPKLFTHGPLPRPARLRTVSSIEQVKIPIFEYEYDGRVQAYILK